MTTATAGDVPEVDGPDGSGGTVGMGMQERKLDEVRKGEPTATLMAGKGHTQLLHTWILDKE